MTAHYEDGCEVPKVVGTVTVSGMRQGVNAVVGRLAMHDLRPGDTLMTVAQHERIVAAKDAEIAQLREARDRYCELWNRAANQTAPQPARQVGGDEHRAFNYPVLHDFANKHGLDYNELCTTARAALAPVASQVDGDDDHLHGHPRYEHDSRDEIELFLRDAYAAGANAAHSRSLTTALDYAARHAPKLRAALAPAALVIPKTELWQCQNTENSNLVYLPYKPQGPWDCLEYVRSDEVARLNRRAIPEGLLERVASPWMDDEELTINRHVAINELRALLSKENI